MNREFDSYTNQITVTGSAEEFYNDRYLRQFLPPYVLETMNAQAEFNALSPAERLQKVREQESNILPDEIREQLLK